MLLIFYLSTCFVYRRCALLGRKLPPNIEFFHFEKNVLDDVLKSAFLECFWNVIRTTLKTFSRYFFHVQIRMFSTVELVIQVYLFICT